MPGTLEPLRPGTNTTVPYSTGLGSEPLGWCSPFADYQTAIMTVLHHRSQAMQSMGFTERRCHLAPPGYGDRMFRFLNDKVRDTDLVVLRRTLNQSA